MDGDWRAGREEEADSGQSGPDRQRVVQWSVVLPDSGNGRPRATVVGSESGSGIISNSGGRPALELRPVGPRVTPRRRGSDNAASQPFTR